MVALVLTLAVIGTPSYDERHPIDPNEGAEDLFMRVCGAEGVGTAGGSETLEEFDQ